MLISSNMDKNIFSRKEKKLDFGFLIYGKMKSFSRNYWNLRTGMYPSGQYPPTDGVGGSVLGAVSSGLLLQTKALKLSQWWFLHKPRNYTNITNYTCCIFLVYFDEVMNFRCCMKSEQIKYRHYPWFSGTRSTIRGLNNLGIPVRYPTGCTQTVSHLTICGNIQFLYLIIAQLSNVLLSVRCSLKM